MGMRVGLEPGGELSLAGDDEPALVARCRGDGPDHAPDHAAFRALYERHVDEVLRFLRRLLGAPDAVEDAAQETFVRLHRGLRGDFDPARAVRPYVLGIARNVAIEAFRRREKLALPALPRPDARSAGDAALARERSALVQDALSALSPEHRAVVVLRYTHELSQDDVASALGCTTRTVRNRLRAAAVLFERELRRRGVLPGDERAPGPAPEFDGEVRS